MAGSKGRRPREITHPLGPGFSPLLHPLVASCALRHGLLLSRSARDEGAQSPRFRTGTTLQLVVAEPLLLAHLCGDDIALMQDESLGGGQLEQILQRQRLLQTNRQLGGGPSMGQEGIKLSQRHGSGTWSTTVLTVPRARCRLAKVGPTPQTCRSRLGPMSQTPASPDAVSGLPNWMRWGGAGLTALVAVLFVVLLQQVRQQGQQLQSLQNRLQTLENAHDLDRTNALEEQLRSTVQRIRNLEGLEQTVQSLSQEQAGLHQQLRSAARSSSGGGSDLEPLLPQETAAPSTGQP